MPADDARLRALRRSYDAYNRGDFNAAALVFAPAIEVCRAGGQPGAGSGIELDFSAWTVSTFDGDGRATRLEIFLEHEEAAALQAAGLPS